MSIGKWVAYTEDGLFENWEDESLFFSTKRDAISQLTSSYLDDRKHPTIKRETTGRYVYSTPDCDCKTIKHTVYIEKVTKQNRNRLKEMADEEE